jgi:hypothetical protein
MNWQQLLDDYNIHYVTRGPNTKKGEISIQCPWCGDDDPSEHLSISLETPNWGCWRNAEHRGKQPLRLIRALLGVSAGQAGLLLAQYGAADPETLDDALTLLTGESKPMETTTELVKLPDNFWLIQNKSSARRFWQYLKGRGFGAPAALARRYSLHYCTTGRWKDRVIIPVWDTKANLIGWTARAIQQSKTVPKYLESNDNIKTMLYREEELNYPGNTLFITEGPFDALKMDYFLYKHTEGSYGNTRAYRNAATCTFGISVSVGQLGKLRAYARNFRRTVVLPDRGAVQQSMQLADMIPAAECRLLPGGVKDPGDLTQDQVVSLLWTPR